MITLAPNEARALGTLIEKALTVPAQYPMTLNGLLLGINQRNNRDPVVSVDEEAVIDALDGLRQKGFAREVSMTGSRVPKFRHLAREVLELSTSQLVLLAELLLRGPQTVGELRGRASRMHPLESTEVVANLLESLRTRAEALVEELPPIPGTRAARFRQLICPDLHPVDAGGSTSRVAPPSTSDDPRLAERVDALERELADLRERLARLEQSLGGGVG
jgi:uncharacterized protein YceH (UPF0502 family)